MDGVLLLAKARVLQARMDGTLYMLKHFPFESVAGLERTIPQMHKELWDLQQEIEKQLML